MTPSRPVIGVTLDWNKPGGYSRLAWYALRENYAGAVVAAGGLPVMLSHDPALIADTQPLLDGLIVTGGDFDVDPVHYGADQRHPRCHTKDRRTAYELDILNAMLAQDKPVLGICGGQQLLNVALGGTLIQHIPDEIDRALAHEQPNPRTEPGHTVTLTPDTLLARITGSTRMNVNSAHHQAVKTLGEGVRVNAVAEDGVIEGIEATKHHFCLGVQWHPEYAIDPSDKKIFAALIAAAGRRG